LASVVFGATGCATLAHRSTVKNDGQVKQSCDGSGGGACPWLLGDAGLLLLGIIPGVIAFAVDFANGEWQHGSGPTTVMVNDDPA
jgi:hypothetical protein